LANYVESLCTSSPKVSSVWYKSGARVRVHTQLVIHISLRAYQEVFHQFEESLDQVFEVELV